MPNMEVFLVSLLPGFCVSRHSCFRRRQMVLLCFSRFPTTVQDSNLGRTQPAQWLICIYTFTLEACFLSRRYDYECPSSVYNPKGAGRGSLAHPENSHVPWSSASLLTVALIKLSWWTSVPALPGWEAPEVRVISSPPL
jgi:hypothetical protein